MTHRLNLLVLVTAVIGTCSLVPLARANAGGGKGSATRAALETLAGESTTRTFCQLGDQCDQDPQQVIADNTGSNQPARVSLTLRVGNRGDGVPYCAVRVAGFRDPATGAVTFRDIARDYHSRLTGLEVPPGGTLTVQCVGPFAENPCRWTVTDVRP